MVKCMKILQVNAVYNVGSTGVIVSDLHKLSTEEGIESHVAYSTSPLSPNDIHNGYRIGNIIGKKIHMKIAVNSNTAETGTNRLAGLPSASMAHSRINNTQRRLCPTTQ